MDDTSITVTEGAQHLRTHASKEIMAVTAVTALEHSAGVKFYFLYTFFALA
jgi:hypothetical protein